MIKTRKRGNNNKRSKWEENKMKVKSKKELNMASESKIKNLLNVKKQQENKRNNFNSISCNNCSVTNISRNNNKFSI